jgi:AraC family transcriptional regulator
MSATTLFRNESVTLVDYRCNAGPTDAPFIEVHGGYSISYVRKGSFGCHTRGADYSPTYYAAFLLDPDGNNVEAVCLR